MDELQKGGRLESLDALRGADMFFIMGGSGVFRALGVLAGCDSAGPFVQQFSHVLWNGLHFQDMIFPTFLFIAGVSFPFSCAKQIERGRDRCSIALRCVRRAALLFLLGLVYNNALQFKFDSLVWGSVLGRIGIAWLCAALLFLFVKGWRARAAVAAALLLGYWAVMLFIEAPDWREIVLPANLAPYADGPFSPARNISAYLDRHLLPGQITVPGVFSNQGTLSTLPAIVTAMIGMFAGEFLRGRGKELSGGARTCLMLAAAACLAAAGLFVAFGCGPWSFPLNKILWSPSFTLVVGGISLAALAVFHYLVDVKGQGRWFGFFRVIGLNSIAIYVLQRFIGFQQANKFFFGGLASLFPQDVGNVVLALGYVAVCWLVLFFFHRHRIYWKV